MALAFVAACAATGCGGGSGPTSHVDAGPQVSPALRADVVAALAQNVLYPETQAFETAATALETSLSAYAADPTNPTAALAAKDAWRATMAALQRLELMQVGPHGFPSSAIGGLGIREEMYAWPIVSRCGVDEHLVAQTYVSTTALAAQPVNVRGMAVIEYLLLNASTANACGTANAINASGTWAALTDLEARRAAYAASAATLVREQATRLREAWDPASGNFVTTLANAGAAGNPYPDAQEALNGISNAMFYLDLSTKDMKVAIPAGISASCGAESCPASVESALSDASLDHIRQNLVAYRLLFTGGDGDALGFDDLLVSIEQGALAQTMLADIDAAIAAVDAVTGPLETAVVATPEEVTALHEAIKRVTDVLKGQFIALLDLDRPMAAAGDND